MNDIDRPIFIVGIGRTGSTVFHKLLSFHKNLSWLSRAINKYPNRPFLNRSIMHMASVPGLRNLIYKYIDPDECYDFWEFHVKGFRRPCRDLTESDLTKNIKSAVQNALHSPITKLRNRLLIKITGWPRIRLLKAIFPDAKFIHIIRDPRAVVNSMLTVDWWLGWRGPQNWRWGELDEEERMIWEEYDKSFIALAAIEWNKIMREYESIKKTLNSSNYLEIRYEDLCENKNEILKVVLDYSGLVHYDRYYREIKSITLRNSNYKWKENFFDGQIEMLNNILGKRMRMYDYM